MGRANETALTSMGDGMAGCTLADLVLVGSKSPKDDARWGQADLAGNVWEWTPDIGGPIPSPCTDCANHTSTSSNDRIVVGGGFYHNPGDGIVFRFDHDPLGSRTIHVGARCARD